jgi:hypothetical protein
MLIAYSGGLHHVQVPGQQLPRLFRRVGMLIVVDIADYRRRLQEEVGVHFKRAVTSDLERRRDLYCPRAALLGDGASRAVLNHPVAPARLGGVEPWSAAATSPEEGGGGGLHRGDADRDRDSRPGRRALVGMSSASTRARSVSARRAAASRSIPGSTTANSSPP